MVHTFTKGGVIPFLPRGWANAVANWLLGIHSDSGTIKIRNNPNPSSVMSAPSVDIDEVATARALAGQLAKEFPRALDGRLIGPGLKWDDGKLCVDEEWIKNIKG